MADLSLDYERIYFENEPSRKTPINARTLNILDEAIYRLYQILRYGGVGSGGRQIELRNNGEYIQWRYVGDDVWTNLASLEELKGAKGDDGNGIVSMEKTSSDGPVDTYTVTFTDGSTFEFRVTNGLSSISSQNGLMLNDGGRRKVKSMISFIDDDCRKETFDKLFPLIKNLGIHYSVACAPGSLDDAENVYMKSSDLQTMYNSGFSVISHHYKQDNMDNTEAYPSYDAYDSNLENCQKRFAELGINDVMAVSYPQGRIVDEYIPSVKKHYKMGFTIDRGINEMPYESFYMKRCELFPENGAYTYLDAQQLVNEVALNGGWLIFMTHAWYPSFNEEVLSDLITYIKGLNIDIVDVNDAIEMTGNIIEIGHVKKPLEERAYPYYIVDANGRTWTNSVNLLEANDRELKEIKAAYLYGAYMNISGNVRSHDDTNRTVSLPVDVVPGEIYYLTCSAIYEQAIYLFYTSDGSVVEGGYRQPETNTSEGIIGNTVLINHEVIVPEGAATMRVSSNWNIQPDGYKIVKVIYPEEKEKGKNNLYGYDTSEQVDEKIRNNFPTYYFSVTKNEDGSYSSDKSYDDINSAYNGSKNLICNYETTFLNISEIITLKLGLVRHTDFDSARIYEFNCIDNDKQYTVCITKDSDSGNTIVTFSEVELGTSFSGSAKDVTYDDSKTQLGADNVQEAIGKVSEQKVDNPSTGAVGQILEIETVDENGKPKTYKAVDKPQGGGTGGDYTLPVATSEKLGGVKPVAKTNSMTQEVGVDSEGKLYTEPTGGGESDTETDSDFAGYSGILFYDNGNIRAYNPIVNTVIDNFKSAKISAYLQHYAKSAVVCSTPDVLAHESGFSSRKAFLISWVENIAGTTTDVPDVSETGATAIKTRQISGGNFASNGVPLPTNDTIVTVAQKGDDAVNTLTGETFSIPYGVGYQTYYEYHVLCGYLVSLGKLRGMTIPLQYASDGTGWKVIIGTRQTWTLTIDGEIGEYDYSRLPSPMNGATLHPSNQVAKVDGKYYRADAVPNNGFVLVSSTDLINWTFVSHVTLPKGFDDKTTTEVCCGEKRSRLYVALRQNPDSGALYVGKMNADFLSINSMVSLPDCGSKPYFYKPSSDNLLLITAPVDRYSCKVYNIPSSYSLSKIVPLFELSGTACNYPVIGDHGYSSGYMSFAGTNGAQSDKKGVSIIPVLLNINTILKRCPDSTDVLLIDNTGKEILYGDLFEIPTFSTETEVTE